ncbi:MAG: hypothetical protein FJW39_04670 [Acidobacteria bacterium]|nr:hypothetical protein [Acidobacteriota bacterium]
MRLAFCLLLVSTVSLSQTSNATLSGRVTDSSGAVLPGVKIAVRNTATAFSADTSSSPEGLYTLALLPPGRYNLRAERQGFSTLAVDRIVLETGARVGLDLELKVAASAESVTVTADAAQLQVQSESGERSELITNRQIRDLALNGRNILDMMKIIPGVVSTVNGQVSNDGGVRLFSINGARGTQKEVTVDGASNVISGANQRVHVTLNPDAIQEVRILTSNYQAEFGKTAGGFIQYTTRSGSNQFHGGARYFRRHDSLNANNFFSNALGLPRQIYRYDYSGYDIGGPVLLPKIGFNRNRDKLFFFWNQEFYRQLIPAGARTLRMPTEAERNGDFSATTDGNGNPVALRDPLNGQPFAGNVIPRARFYADGQAILNVYPGANDTRGGARYNYSSQLSTQTPRREDIIRMDYNITDKTRLFGRFIQNTETTEQPYGGCNNIAFNYPLSRLKSTQAPRNAAFNLVHSFSPSLINELMVAPSRSKTTCDALDQGMLRSTHRINNFPLIFRNLDGSEVMPSFMFGGIANQTYPTNDIGKTPKRSGDANITITNNVSKLTGKHSFKTGFYFQQNRFYFTGRTPVNGDANFSNDVNNPLNAGHPYANALLGVYSQFAQADAQPEGRPQYRTIEGFVQDTWKVTSRLTLDYGLRISYIGPSIDQSSNNNVFLPEQFNPARAVRLYTPVRVGTAARAVDPANRPPTLTMANTLPAAFSGLIVPGSGDVLNGIAQARNGYLRGGFEARGSQWGPRFGFAYNASGDRSMVVRGGFGISYERVQGNVLLGQVNTPPTVTTPRLFYGTVADLANTSSGTLAPVNMNGYPRDGKIPNVYSYNLGIQKTLVRGTVLDVAYVGSLSRHLVQSRNLNAIPYFLTFQRAAQDPSRFADGVVPAVEAGLPAVYSQAGYSFSGNNALPLNFLRPFPGFGEINYREFAGSANYHALQVSASRRLGTSLTFDVAYTWSKNMNTGDVDFEGNHPYDTRRYDYSLADFDRTHTLVANYVYEIPTLPMAQSGKAKLVFGGWQVSGISQFYTGAPFELGLGIQGINAAQRMVGSYNLPVRPYRHGGASMRGNGIEINPDAFYVPGIADIGPYPRTYLRQPWFINHDLSVFKNIPLGDNPARRIQIRLEMFNFLNSTQFASVNSGTQLVTPAGAIGAAVFNSFGNLRITNNLRPAGHAAPLGQFFGEFNSARDPRIIQLAAKFYF